MMRSLGNLQKQFGGGGGAGPLLAETTRRKALIVLKTERTKRSFLFSSLRI